MCRKVKLPYADKYLIWIVEMEHPN
jgi:hypothetical protein